MTRDKRRTVDPPAHADAGAALSGQAETVRAGFCAHRAVGSSNVTSAYVIDRTPTHGGHMGPTFVLVAFLAVGAYTVGYLVGRSERRSRLRQRQAWRMGQLLQQATMDRPGNPRMN